VAASRFGTMSGILCAIDMHYHMDAIGGSHQLFMRLLQVPKQVLHLSMNVSVHEQSYLSI